MRKSRSKSITKTIISVSFLSMLMFGLYAQSLSFPSSIAQAAQTDDKKPKKKDPTPTLTPTISTTPTATPSATPTPDLTPTATPSATPTPDVTPTANPSATPTPVVLPPVPEYTPQELIDAYKVPNIITTVPVWGSPEDIGMGPGQTEHEVPSIIRLENVAGGWMIIELLEYPTISGIAGYDEFGEPVYIEYPAAFGMEIGVPDTDIAGLNDYPIPTVQFNFFPPPSDDPTPQPFTATVRVGYVPEDQTLFDGVTLAGVDQGIEDGSFTGEVSASLSQPEAASTSWIAVFQEVSTSSDGTTMAQAYSSYATVDETVVPVGSTFAGLISVTGINSTDYIDVVTEYGILSVKANGFKGVVTDASAQIMFVTDDKGKYEPVVMSVTGADGLVLKLK